MEELTKWEFREELFKLVEGCVGNKKETAKRKASKFYYKYDSIIDTNTNYYEGLYRDVNVKYKCLKSGYISFDGGILKLSQIECIKTVKSSYDSLTIEVRTKSGDIQSFSKEFKWLLDLFN